MAEVIIQVELLKVPEVTALLAAAATASAAWNSEDNDALTESMVALEKALVALDRLQPRESEATDGK